jgi:hypothetical protein
MNDMNETSLAVTRNQPVTIMQAPPFMETMEIARALAASGFFKDCRAPEQAFAKILAGQEIGIGAMASLSGIHIVDGKPTLDATLVGAQIKKSGRYDYRVKVSNENECVLEFYERGKAVGESSFNMQDAQRAGLNTRAVWKAYPKDMLRSRAITRGARTYCPDVFNGAIYTPEEIGADVEIDNSGAMKLVSAGADPDPQQTPDNAEREELVNTIYGMVSVDPEIKGSAMHALRMKRVAEVVGASTIPTRWSGFSLNQLRAFVTQQTQSIERCGECGNIDGTHRDGCTEDPEAADILAQQYQEAQA